MSPITCLNPLESSNLVLHRCRLWQAPNDGFGPITVFLAQSRQLAGFGQKLSFTFRRYSNDERNNIMLVQPADQE